MRKTGKKIIILIVEGPTDQRALEHNFREICNPDKLLVKVVHGDITSDFRSDPSNIVCRIGDLIENFRKDNYLKKADICEIIHLVDTDGTFIEEDMVVSGDKLLYYDDCISAVDRDTIIRRIRRKSSNIRRLITTKTICNIPYSVYFMSVNLDHVLYNFRNLNSFDKEKYAFLFAEKYWNNTDEFIRYICHSEFSLNGDYRNSWDFIQRDENSLHRYTNFPISIMEKVNSASVRV